MTLTCKTQPPRQKSGVQLQFCFFKHGSALGRSWNDSPELHITALKREDSGSYWCEAKITDLKVIRSRSVPIEVQSECPWGLLLGGKGVVSLGCADCSVLLPPKQELNLSCSLYQSPKGPSLPLAIPTQASRRIFGHTSLCVFTLLETVEKSCRMHGP